MPENKVFSTLFSDCWMDWGMKLSTQTYRSQPLVDGNLITLKFLPQEPRLPLVRAHQEAGADLDEEAQRLSAIGILQHELIEQVVQGDLSVIGVLRQLTIEIQTAAEAVADYAAYFMKGDNEDEKGNNA